MMEEKSFCLGKAYHGACKAGGTAMRRAACPAEKFKITEKAASTGCRRRSAPSRIFASSRKGASGHAVRSRTGREKNLAQGLIPSAEGGLYPENLGMGGEGR